MLGRVARSPSKTFLFCSGAFIAGVAAHAPDEFPWPSQVGLAVMGAAVVLPAVWRWPRWRLIGLLISLFLTGVVRYDIAVRDAVRQPVGLPIRVSDFVGIVGGEPKNGLRQTVLGVSNVAVSENGAWRPLGGFAQVKIGTGERVRAGDTIRWSCRPDTAVVAPELAVSRLLLRGVVWSCRPSTAIAVVSSARRAGFLSILIATRQAFRGLINRLLPEPESSFLLGLFIGDRDGLPPRLADDFRKSGTAHIVAVSGYNVSRVVDVCLIVLAVAAVRRKRAASLTIVLVAAFAVLAGGEASVTRAGLMGGLSLVATVLGRRRHATNSLAGAAALMLAANPFVLRHDVGFQLSFAAVWGLHAMGPTLTRRAGFLPEFAGIRQTFGETAAATIFTMPLSLFHFGTLPAVGLMANLFILPLVPWSMAAGALMTALGAIYPMFGVIPAFVTYWLLRLIESLAGFFALAAPVSLTVQIDGWTVAALYLWIGLLWFALTKAKPIVIRHERSDIISVRGTSPEIIEVEIIDHEH